MFQNLEFIRSHNPTHVLILAGDHIYKMDYGPMIAYHEQCEAAITVGGDVPIERANEFGILTTDDTIAPSSSPRSPRIRIRSSVRKSRARVHGHLRRRDGPAGETAGG